MRAEAGIAAGRDGWWSAAGALDRFAGARVAVLGECMLDAYLLGSARRLSPEAPIPVVDVAEERLMPGGAANSASNLAELGAKVRLVSVVGDDREADAVEAVLTAAGVECELHREPGRRTLIKTRTVADGVVLVRSDRGDVRPPATLVNRALRRSIVRAFDECDAVLVSDYGYGVVNEEALASIADSAAGHRDTRIVVDSKELGRFRRVGISAAKPNYRQAAEILRLPAADDSVSRLAQIREHGSLLPGLLGAEAVVVTLDRDGCVVFVPGRHPLHVPARSVWQPSAAGAGDTFAAAFTLALLSGADPAQAAELASTAAAIVVEKPLTGTCSADELTERLRGSKLQLSEERLVATVERHRRMGRRIVMTAGCFDVLHPGHVATLEAARRLGDVLVVAINTDAGVSRLKGPSRPFNPLDDRAGVVGGLASVDLVVPFDDELPIPVIEMVRPDVYVKGGDYRREDLPEAPVVEAMGGRVEIVPFVGNHSTTRLAERMTGAAPAG